MSTENRPHAAITGEMDTQELLRYIKYTYQLLIDDLTADTMKHAVISDPAAEPRRELAIRGRNLVSGLPVTVKIHSGEIEQIFHTVQR